MAQVGFGEFLGSVVAVPVLRRDVHIVVEQRHRQVVEGGRHEVAFGMVVVAELLTEPQLVQAEHRALLSVLDGRRLVDGLDQSAEAVLVLVLLLLLTHHRPPSDDRTERGKVFGRRKQRRLISSAETRFRFQTGLRKKKGGKI